jgi:hypothetical protein
VKEKNIPDDVRNFLIGHINSVAKLEALFLLAKNPNRSWLSAEVSKQMRSNDELINTFLSAFCKEKLLDCDVATNTYIYKPTAELRDVVEKLIKLYATYQLRIIEIIYEERVNSVQKFADAFKIRKEDNDDG